MVPGFISFLTLVALLVEGIVPPTPTDPGKSNNEIIPLPKEAEDWDEIGTYQLKEKGISVRVKLYYFDSDSWTEKLRKKEGVAMGMYPNHFSLHAVYRVGSDPWKHKELFAAARVGFLKVIGCNTKAVRLQIRSKYRLMMNPDGSLPLDEKTIERIYQPVTKTITVKNSVPVLE
jgi:hypothetical protein